MLWLLSITLLCIAFWNFSAGLWIMGLVLVVLSLGNGWYALKRDEHRPW